MLIRQIKWILGVYRIIVACCNICSHCPLTRRMCRVERVAHERLRCGTVTQIHFDKGGHIVRYTRRSDIPIHLSIWLIGDKFHIMYSITRNRRLRRKETAGGSMWTPTFAGKPYLITRRIGIPPTIHRDFAHYLMIVVFSCGPTNLTDISRGVIRSRRWWK